MVGVLGEGVVDAAAPVLRADDLGALRGDGCFETVRVRHAAARALDSFDAHLARLARSAAALDLAAPDDDAWHDLVAGMLAAWERSGEAVLRLVLTRGAEGGEGRPSAFAVLSRVPADTLRQRAAGVRVVTLGRGMPADAHSGAPWLLGGVKATSYAVNMAAIRHARSLGAEDVIFVSTDGQLLEGPTATVVWAADGTLRTPPAEPLGILDGTTVRRLVEHAADVGLSAEVARGTVADLLAADGVWLVSSIRIAATVTELDGTALTPPADLTARVQHAAAFPGLLPRNPLRAPMPRT